jgi:hypothetical protein
MYTIHTENRFAANPHLDSSLSYLESGLKIQWVVHATEQGVELTFTRYLCTGVGLVLPILRGGAIES